MIMLSQKLSSNPQGTGTRQALSSSNSVLLNSRTTQKQRTNKHPISYKENTTEIGKKIKQKFKINLTESKAVFIVSSFYLSSPRISLALNLLNSAKPRIGRYSLTLDLKYIKHDQQIYRTVRRELVRHEKHNGQSSLLVINKKLFRFSNNIQNQRFSLLLLAQSDETIIQKRKGNF